MPPGGPSTPSEEDCAWQVGSLTCPSLHDPTRHSPLLQDQSRDHPSCGDDVCSLPAVTSECRGPAPRARHGQIAPPSRDSGFVQSRSTSSRLSWFLPPPLLHSCRRRRENCAVSSASPIRYADRQRPALRSFATHPGAISVIQLSTISAMVFLGLMCIRRSARRPKVRPGSTSSTCEGAERS